MELLRESIWPLSEKKTMTTIRRLHEEIDVGLLFLLLFPHIFPWLVPGVGSRRLDSTQIFPPTSCPVHSDARVVPRLKSSPSWLAIRFQILFGIIVVAFVAYRTLCATRRGAAQRPFSRKTNSSRSEHRVLCFINFFVAYIQVEWESVSFIFGSMERGCWLLWASWCSKRSRSVPDSLDASPRSRPGSKFRTDRDRKAVALQKTFRLLRSPPRLGFSTAESDVCHASKTPQSCSFSVSSRYGRSPGKVGTLPCAHR